MKIVNYVVGFMFDKEHNVWLIKKNKPEWQKGRYNGIGGKIESYDLDHYAAMSREFFEETSALTEPYEWTEFCTYGWKDGIVHFFYLHDLDLKHYGYVRTNTDEEVCCFGFSAAINTNSIYNLKWLLPLALDPSLDFEKNGPIIVNE
jgi:8-oxo-dGTP diphosphatase